MGSVHAQPRQNPGNTRPAPAMTLAFDPKKLRALAFAVFGTAVDWRASIIREDRLLSAAKGLQVDWPAFADAWRAGYAPAMDRTRGAGQIWADIDTLHRQSLDELLPRFGLIASDFLDLADQLGA